MIRRPPRSTLFPYTDALPILAADPMSSGSCHVTSSCQHGPCHTATQLRSSRSEEHTSELQSQFHLVCRLLLEKKKKKKILPRIREYKPKYNQLHTPTSSTTTL